MRSPMIEELPPGLPGKTGWPWTEESSQLPQLKDDGEPWPKISIVTPSFNQGRYLEETIRSVLLQGYPDIEYIIIDGGSKDESIDVIKKYEKWLTYWVSEPDCGQSHALNKGFQCATGIIAGYINSDDLYERDAFAAIARSFNQFEKSGLVAGACQIFNESNLTHLSKPWWSDDLAHYLEPFGSTFAQPSSFWTASLYKQVNGFDESLHYAFDKEYFLKIGLSGIHPKLIDQTIARYRDHQKAKTRSTIKFYEEAIPIVEKYGRQCGLSEDAIRKRLRRIRNDIQYFQTFQVWKQRGRKAAIYHFVQRAVRCPDFLLDRKVLGLARRLLFFRAAMVGELKNV